MWFKKKSTLPGIAQHADGQISFKLTDEEQAEVSSFFRALDEPREDGALYVHPDAHKALTALALIGYAKQQVILSETETEGANRDSFIRKALAAATKAYSFHSLPIYMFDMGCIFEMLGETAPAQNAFRSFLQSQQTLAPSDVDRIALRGRDIEEAIKQAVERTR